jgi:hypothetical protein
MAEKALTAVIQEAYIGGISTRSVQSWCVCCCHAIGTRTARRNNLAGSH